MQVQASSIGYAVPRGDFDAAIQSVFDTAVNLKPADQAGLITLFTSERHDLPQGTRLDSKGINFKHLQVGDRAACRAGILHLPSLNISLHGARPWRCDLSSLNIDIKKPEIKAAWETVFETLDARQAVQEC